MQSVYFFLRPYRTKADAGFQHRCVALAEGFQKIGVPYFSNIDYWRFGPELEKTLFRRDASVEPSDCDVLVCEQAFFDDNKRLPLQFAQPSKKYRTVFIDSSDGWRTPALGEYSKGVDIVLKCHFNTRFRYGDNVRPWAFGLTDRIQETLNSPLPWSQRRKAVLYNFRCTHPVRSVANTRFLPHLAPSLLADGTTDNEAPRGRYDSFMWDQTGGRHHPSFYARLEQNAACAAFGGYFVPTFSSSLDSLALRAAYRFITASHMQTRSVAQFDSSRLWESLAAACLTFHVDLERYGCLLPAMPTNGVHYYGVDLSRPEKEAERIRECESSFEAVSQAGREWCIANYSSEATARRFLKFVAE
jgi:hypothetical protein